MIIYMTNNKKIPLLILVADTQEKFLIPHFFEEENNSFYEKLKNPNYLRYSGWNLLTLDIPKIRKGEFWEVKGGDRKTIRLYPNGTLFAVADADNTFLAWGQNDEDFMKSPRLNVLAIIEYVYEFVELYKGFLENFPESRIIRFTVAIKNGVLENKKRIYLKPYEVNSLEYQIDIACEEDNYGLDKDFSESILIEVVKNSYDSKYISYRLLSTIFNKFNIPSDKIPYTLKDEKGDRYIDIGKIKSIS